MERVSSMARDTQQSQTGPEQKKAARPAPQARPGFSGLVFGLWLYRSVGCGLWVGGPRGIQSYKKIIKPVITKAGN